MKKLIATCAAATAILAFGTAGGAVAGSLVTSKQIQDDTIKSRDVLDGGLRGKDFSSNLRERINSDSGSHLIVGSGYTSTWKAGEFGQSVETCPEGQFAIGGGYSTWGGFNGLNDGYDLGGTNRDIEVTVSAPYFKGAYEPVDEAGNFRADQWVVRGFNSGATDQIVRAWVVCAD